MVCTLIDRTTLSFLGIYFSFCKLLIPAFQASKDAHDEMTCQAKIIKNYRIKITKKKKEKKEEAARCDHRRSIFLFLPFSFISPLDLLWATRREISKSNNHNNSFFCTFHCNFL